MRKFRFGIMGAGNIANKFCDAITRLPECEVAAVASKSLERAKNFAKKNEIAAYYDDYEEMLRAENLGCVYIAVLPKDHYELCMLCLNYGIPVLCEKAMVTNQRQADEIFALSVQKKIFTMEAMWSFFLPALQKVKQWVKEGRIGKVSYLDMGIGYLEKKDPANRFFNPALGGGVTYDMTVYLYEITRFLLEEEPLEERVASLWDDTGVNVTDHILLLYEDKMAELKASIIAPMEEKMILYGREGKIVLPVPHYPDEAYLYDRKGKLVEHFIDTETENGFVYEIREAVCCIREGKIESSVASHEITRKCARMFGKIMEKNKK